MTLPWNIISDAAALHKIPAYLLAAIVQQESRGKIWTSRLEPGYRYIQTPEIHAKRLGISPETERVHQATSWGLAQVMGGTLRDLGFMDHLPMACKPSINLTFASMHLSRLMAKHPVMAAVISAYNSGTPRKDATGAYTNQGYVDRVTKFMSELKPDLV
jgi:soluble lytic murein transglycosylase-like protein